jgi:hypothetical protein
MLLLDPKAAASAGNGANNNKGLTLVDVHGKGNGFLFIFLNYFLTYSFFYNIIF